MPITRGHSVISRDYRVEPLTISIDSVGLLPGTVVNSTLRAPSFWPTFSATQRGVRNDHKFGG